MPVYGLFDYDPDGIGILYNYKYGSARYKHDTSSVATPRITWLGVRSCHVFDLEERRQAGNNEQGLMHLSARDRKKATKMLDWPHVVEESSELRRELQIMLILGYKAEIQVVGAADGGLLRWVEDKMVVL